VLTTLRETVWQAFNRAASERAALRTSGSAGSSKAKAGTELDMVTS